MKRINSLNDLFMEELSSLLNGENQLVEGLPKMADASQSPALKAALEEYMKMSREHVSRLQDIFGNTGQSPQKLAFNAIKDFLKECEDIVNKTELSQTRDFAIIWVMQRMEQYEIAEYKKVREHAADLNHSRIVELLTTTLNEERSMNFHLNELAQGSINAQAVESPSKGKIEGFYMPEGKFGRKGIKKKTKSTDTSRFIDEGNPDL